MSAASAVFWGLVTLSFLVFIHEGGHFLAARACGMRVTEFYLGMPCRFKIFRKSRRYGTEVGVTPILLGGYTRICGMDGQPDPRIADMLWLVQEKGRISAADAAAELGCSEDDAYTMLAMLVDWASIEPYFNPELGEKPGQRDWPEAFQTVKRDAKFLTEYDRESDFTMAGASEAGEARLPQGDAQSFCASEMKHTYAGHGFWARIFTLFAGPLVNLVFALLVVMAGLSIAGVTVSVNENTIGQVVSGSLADASGLEAGDTVEAVNGTAVTDWQSLVSALQPCLADGSDFTLEISRDGAEQTLYVDQDESSPSTTLGIVAPTQTVHLSLADSFKASISYAQQVADAALSLIRPSQTMQVLNESTSVMGISVMASEAASQGAWELMLFMAMISMSLGFMNLLPIPPLDGGKIVIEIGQKICRKNLPQKAQIGISYAGLAFFLFVFVFVLRNDILRFVVG
ncbi:MAG: M50 family metallopeptidase [Atopobiaceae bacterium]